MAAMAEFLVRGWNVAIPEVDVGDDLFVVRDRDGDLSRIQVKTATAIEQAYGFSARFNVPLDQLRDFIVPELTFVFAVRHTGRWEPFVVIERARLNERHTLYGIGSEAHGRLLLHFRYERGRVTCGPVDLAPHVNDWARWPVIEHG